MDKFKVDFKNGVASFKDERFRVFTDSKGLKVFTKNGVVFLNEKNAEVV